MTRAFRQNLSKRLVDFLEIASYVFSADCATPRGKKWADGDSAEPWTRDFAFVIPVRDFDFWKARKIKGLIEEILGFLSNDKYSFTFVPLDQDRTDQSYFEFGDLQNWSFHGPDRVLMFSGGLDSLAGAVETAAGGGRLVLVSHRSVSTIDARQRTLFDELGKMFANRLIRVPVWINKRETLGREPTQRTRSFLFAALGTLVAHSLEAQGVRFYENGVVSVNLPLAQEVLRARASRTTHPIALHLLSELCAAVVERDFVVDNPYLFKTKTEVVKEIAMHGSAALIPLTCSCSHSMFQTATQRHCGRCSQCIDRKFATTAAGLQEYDADKDYVLDVFTGPRKEPLDRAIAIDYARHGIELSRWSESDVAGAFNAELTRAVRYYPKRSEAARQLISTHRRHGSTVSEVLEQKLKDNASSFLKGEIDSTSLLAMAFARTHLQKASASTSPHVERKADSSHDDDSQGPETAKLNKLCQLVSDLHAKIDAKGSTTPEKERKTKSEKARCRCLCGHNQKT